MRTAITWMLVLAGCSGEGVQQRTLVQSPGPGGPDVTAPDANAGQVDSQVADAIEILSDAPSDAAAADAPDAPDAPDAADPWGPVVDPLACGADGLYWCRGHCIAKCDRPIGSPVGDCKSALAGKGWVCTLDDSGAYCGAVPNPEFDPPAPCDALKKPCEHGELKGWCATLSDGARACVPSCWWALDGWAPESWQ